MRTYNWGAIAQSDAFALPAVAGYGVSLLGAILGDALQFQVDRHAQLFTTLREWVSSAVPIVESSVSPEDRRVQAEMMLALVHGAAIGSKLVPVLQPLALDINAFAQTLVTAGTNWLHEALVAVRDQGNMLGHNVATLSAQLASAVADVALAIGASQTTVQNYLSTVLVPFVQETAQGIANAVTDFVGDVAGAFDLGRTLSFSDLNPFTSAYAAALNDRTITSEIRTALEEAREIVQQAGQTVVVQQGIGANPFDIAGFNPDDAPLATGTVREEGANVFTAYLPYAAGTGGQAVQLKLNGLGANTVTVLTNGQELTPQNSAVTVIVPEGQQQLLFVLRAPDVSANTVLSVNAVLVNSTGTATHVEQQEATVSLVDSTITYDDGRPVLTITSLVPEPDNDHNYIFLAPDGWVGDIALKSGHDQIYGSSLGEFITGGYGHDRIDGGGGSDTILGGNYFLNQEPTPIPFEEADGDDMCWAATPMCWPSGILLGSVST